MPQYEYREDSGYQETIEAASDTAAQNIAAQYLRDGDWGRIERTTRVAATVQRAGSDPDGLPWERLRVHVDLQPEEPACTAGEHAWLDGAVWGSGTGVCYTDTCRHCGVRRRVDTGATDTLTGETMRVVEYLPPLEPVEQQP